MFFSLVITNLDSLCKQLISEHLDRSKSVECDKDPGKLYRLTSSCRINGLKT